MFSVDCADLSLKRGPVALDCGARIVLGEAEVERMAAVNLGKSAFSGGEAM
jgi:hypothetical protein